MQQVLKEQFLDIVEYTIQFISIFIIIRKGGKMKKLKIIIDILLFIITIALFNIGQIGNLMHEILGIALAILIIIHILLNFYILFYL